MVFTRDNEKEAAPEIPRLNQGFPVATARQCCRNQVVVMNAEPQHRFTELCELIAWERDIEKFSALVTELNRLDPTRRVPVVSKELRPA